MCVHRRGTSASPGGRRLAPGALVRCLQHCLTSQAGFRAETRGAPTPRGGLSRGAEAFNIPTVSIPARRRGAVLDGDSVTLTACGELEAFVNEVNDDVAEGILTTAYAATLLDGPLGAIAIMAAVPC